MAVSALNPQEFVTSQPATAMRPSKLPAFLQSIAQYEREFAIYDDGWRGWSYQYSEVARMAAAFTVRLRDSGIGKGDHVVIWSESRPGWIAALWSCLVTGVVLVPVDPQASAALFQRIADKVQPRAILLGDAVAGPNRPLPVPVWPVRELEASGRESLEQYPALNSDDTAEIVFTSGTTAEPKGVVMTHRNLAACLAPLEDQLAPYRKYIRLLAPVRVLNLLPMSHLFGQAIAMFLVPLVPASVVFTASTSPEEIARQIHKRRICALVSVPKVLDVLRNFIMQRFPETKDADASGPALLRWWRYRRVHRFLGWRFCCFIVGGAPLASELEQFWSNLGFVVVQGYGLTETAPIISFSHPFHVSKETAGKPMAGVQIKIAEDGEVLVRGDNVTPGYFQLPSETAAAFQDGWFRTGDIGQLSSEGDLVIRGRKKEVIVAPEGLKIFPEDVEAVLTRIPGVHDAAVLEKNGVHAVLILEPDAKSEEVIRQANQRLEPHQRIRTFSVWTAGELPRTSTTHKLRRAEIAGALQSGKQAATGRRITLTDLLQKYAPGRTITPETTLEELGLSSLDRVQLMMEMEQLLETSIDENVFATVTKVADLSRPMAAAPSAPEPVNNRRWFARLLRHALLPTVFLPLTRIFAHLKISGRHNLRDLKGPVIFAANHQSHLDTPILMASLPRNWRYQIATAMWKEYFEAYFFPEKHTLRERLTSTILYRLITVLFNAFPVPQVETGTRQSLRYIGELVEEGWSILIFPEGERTLTGKIGTFFPGVAVIASRMGVPVVPIHIIGADRVLHRGTNWPRPGQVEVRIGTPLVVRGDSYPALAKQVEDAVRAL